MLLPRSLSGCPSPGIWWSPLLLVFLGLSVVLGTNRYYVTYLPVGSGDTLIQTWHGHGGPVSPNRKWNIECQDGEAMTGINDWADDFELLTYVWCKHMFPLKPSTNGLYPYYPGCHVRNMTTDFHCYDPTRPERTVNTFVTGIWDNDHWFFIFRVGPDNLQPYKCCKTPMGYYIDYLSCYYQTTHDQFFEYYDSQFQFVVLCATGYVITGMAKKINPYEGEMHLDYIQCCRVGYGRPMGHKPPVTYSPNGTPVFYSQTYPQQNTVGAGYSPLYRNLDSDDNVSRWKKAGELAAANQSYAMALNRRKAMETWAPEEMLKSSLNRGMMTEESINQKFAGLLSKRETLE